MSALTGVKVIELEGIGPGPLGACVLSDFGADVVSVSRFVKGRVMAQGDPVSRGKRSIAIDLKSAAGLALMKEMVKQADVFIEAFRPGVAEKLGLGPDELCTLNPRLVYARMTGWGQGGDPKVSATAGHDANYISLSGALSLFRRFNETPSPPVNFAGDYAGGGMMMAMGIMLALLERHRSGKGQVVDAAMVDGANYVALPIFKWAAGGNPFMPTRPDGNIDTSKSVLHQAPHYVQVYECKDHTPSVGKWMSVQAIEPQFYAALLKGLGLDPKRDALPGQNDQKAWPWMRARLATLFKTRTRAEWEAVFHGTDACCWPILTPAEAAVHPHAVGRGSFAPTPGRPGRFEPSPAPKLSRTPGIAPRPGPVPGGDTAAVLLQYGVAQARAAELAAAGVINGRAAKL